MATDTARVVLELASGRNENTAPFHQTAQRRRKQLEPGAASVDAPDGAPPPTQYVVDVPLATVAQLDAAPARDRTRSRYQPVSTSRPPWIAFICALIAVGVAVWWVMSLRMPDIDPRVVIERNLDDAQTAMADGRYTDPPERSAFHYYSTVLALEPGNADAIAGIDAIADRHLTNARVSLAARKIAEAGVALEKARRVRPDHNGLAPLETQWRDELRKILAASTAKPVSEPVPRAAPTSTVAKPKAALQRSTDGHAPQARTPAVAAAPEIEQLPPEQVAGSAPELPREAIAQARVTDLGAAAAALAASQPTTPSNTLAALPATEPAPSASGATNSSANIIDEEAAQAATSVAAGATSVEPRLVKMVQPQYPQEALMRGLEGWVDVSLQVSPSGDVIAPRIEESSRGRMFNRAALSAVQQWKYEPRGATSERVRVRLQFEQPN